MRIISAIQNLTVFLFAIILSSQTSAQQATPTQNRGKWGYKWKDSTWLVKPKFKVALAFSEGFGVVANGNKWGIVDMNGKYLVKPQYSKINSFSEDRAAVLITNEDEQTQNWGFLNTSGELIIEPKYKRVESFKKGKSLVSFYSDEGTEQYYINVDGKRLSPDFRTMTRINPKIWLITNLRSGGNKLYGYLNEDGTKYTEWYLNNFNPFADREPVCLPSKPKEPLVPGNVYQGNVNRKLWAFRNSDGKIISPWYHEYGRFQKGYGTFRVNYRWGIIDSTFTTLCQPIFDEILHLGTFGNDYYFKASNEYRKWYACDKNGKKTGTLPYENIEKYNDSLLIGTHTQEFKGKTLIQKVLFNLKGQTKSSWYNEIHPAKNGKIRVEVSREWLENGKVHFGNFYNYLYSDDFSLSTNWRRILYFECDKLKSNFLALKDSLQHKSRTLFSAESLNYQNKFDRQIHFDDQNKTISFRGFDNGSGYTIWATKHGNQIKFGYRNSQYSIVTDCKFDAAYGFHDGKAIVMVNGKFGVISNSGNYLIQPKYELLGSFGGDLAPYFNGEKWGYLNSKGQHVIAPLFEEASSFEDGLAIVKKDGFWGIIDNIGNFKLEPSMARPPEFEANGTIKIHDPSKGWIPFKIIN